jgi:hypothetical protein
MHMSYTEAGMARRRSLMRGVKRFKVSSDQNGEDEFRWLEIRDELIGVSPEK